MRKLLGKAPVDRDDLRFWYYRLTDADVRNYARVAGLRLEGPQYCNVRSGLGRTWDGVLVTEDSYENLIRFKANPLVKVIRPSAAGVGLAATQPFRPHSGVSIV